MKAPSRTCPILLLAGPTASGKSALALEWARTHDAVILNADSMQHYRDTPVLAACPTEAEMAEAPHVLYRHLGPQSLWSTGEWLRAARPFVEAALRGDHPLCIVGGTGLYFLSLVRGLAEIPVIDEGVRHAARALYDAEGEAAFRARLKVHDPESEARIMANDRQRLCRAWEVFAQTARPLSVWQADTRPVLEPLSYRLDVLMPERAMLYERCDRRFDAMLDGGALEEVSALLAQGYRSDWAIGRVLGLAPLAAHLLGETGLADARAEAQQATRNYAKRQVTFFSGQFAR